MPDGQTGDRGNNAQFLLTCGKCKEVWELPDRDFAFFYCKCGERLDPKNIEEIDKTCTCMGDTFDPACRIHHVYRDAVNPPQSRNNSPIISTGLPTALPTAHPPDAIKPTNETGILPPQTPTPETVERVRNPPNPIPDSAVIVGENAKQSTAAWGVNDHKTIKPPIVSAPEADKEASRPEGIETVPQAGAAINYDKLYATLDRGLTHPFPELREHLEIFTKPRGAIRRTWMSAIAEGVNRSADTFEARILGRRDTVTVYAASSVYGTVWRWPRGERTQHDLTCACGEPAFALVARDSDTDWCCRGCTINELDENPAAVTVIRTARAE